MPQITLYRKDGACSMVPHLLLRELQIRFSAIRMKQGPDGGYEAADGTLSYKDYFKLNGTGYVPTLIVDDFVITEMPALIHYISSLAPERYLLGTTVFERVRAEEWMVWLGGTLHAQGFGAFWRPNRFADDVSMYPAIVAKGKQLILKCYDRIENRIQGRFALGGQQTTAVDFYLHTFYRWGFVIGVDMAAYPKYTAVAREVEKLDSVRAVMAEERESLRAT